MKINDKFEIPESCEPYFYTTYDDLTSVNIGDVITITFGDKTKTKFLVNNFMEHHWRRATRRLAIIPIDCVDFENQSFQEDDVIILDDADRFDCLMIDLYEINRLPFEDWEENTVEFINDDTIDTYLRNHKLNQIV